MNRYELFHQSPGVGPVLLTYANIVIKYLNRSNLRMKKTHVGLLLQRDGASLQGSHGGSIRKVAGCTKSVFRRHRVRKRK